MSSKLIHLNTNDSKLGRKRVAEEKKNNVMRANIPNVPEHSLVAEQIYTVFLFLWPLLPVQVNHMMII